MLKIGRSTFVKSYFDSRGRSTGDFPAKITVDGIGRAFVTSAADRIGM